MPSGCSASSSSVVAGEHSSGGWAEDYGDYDTGEYAGTEDVVCGCWDDQLLSAAWRVPRWIARRFLGWTPPGAAGYSTEPPF